ncbi:MAG: hypothetical protein M1G31_33890 [Pseudanabaena sp. Salubria-1]|nr:hypothetical protein [Pseudanabaena sp. Salubria-1]
MLNDAFHARYLIYYYALFFTFLLFLQPLFLNGARSQLPKLAHFASRALVDTYDEFIKILHQDIDEIIQDIQENPELKQNDSEDRLTLDTLVNLRGSMSLFWDSLESQ